MIFNLEKNKTEPQTIVVNAICQTLNINKNWLIDGTGKNVNDRIVKLICFTFNVNENWLIDGTGKMEVQIETSQSEKILTELYNIAKELSEEEQLYLLDTTKALKQRLSKNN